MRKEITVSIQNPCHEDWKTMTPQSKGRHCKVCEKTVVDFTNKSDEYIVKTFEKETKLCGRFKKLQLDRPLAYNRNYNTNYLAIAGSALLAYVSLGTNISYAQGMPITNKTAITKTRHLKGKIAQSVLKTKVVAGTIFDEDNFRVPFAIITIKGTKIKTESDINGDFIIRVNSIDNLLVEINNYSIAEIAITKNNRYEITLFHKRRTKVSKKDKTSKILENVIPIYSLKKQSSRVVVGSAITGQSLQTYSRKQKRVMRRLSLKRRTIIGRILYFISSPFRKNKKS